MQYCNKKLCGIHSHIMNEVGFCPDVSGVLSSDVLSVWGFVLWGFVPSAHVVQCPQNLVRLKQFYAY